MGGPRTSNIQKMQICFLANKKISLEEVNKILGTSISKATFSRIKSEYAKYITQNEFSEYSELFKKHLINSKGIDTNTEIKTISEITPKSIEQITPKSIEQITPKTIQQAEVEKEMDVLSEKLVRFFGVSIDDVIYSDDAEQKRNLKLIFEEYERLFEMQITDNVKYSLQEKYEALMFKNLEAVKIIVDCMRFVKRRSENTKHKWKFFNDNLRSKEEKIVGTVVNLIKSHLDGKIHRALSETQHKVVDTVKNVLGVDYLSSQAECKLMSMLTKYDVLDIVSETAKLKNQYDPQELFMSEVEKIMNSKSTISLVGLENEV